MKPITAADFGYHPDMTSDALGALASRLNNEQLDELLRLIRIEEKAYADHADALAADWRARPGGSRPGAAND